MIRKIISIDENKCTGCGLCTTACHEGAIEIIDGKAKLIRENHCDGFGDCLPVCPEGAISFEEREAPAYDEKTVKNSASHQSMLSNWPCQLKLVPVSAPYFDKAKLLIAADCTAFAYADIHTDLMKSKVCLIACPKLDAEDYSIKLSNIIRENDISEITVLRMEVPCCGGLEYYTKKALESSGKELPFNVITVSIDGLIMDI